MKQGLDWADMSLLAIILLIFIYGFFLSGCAGMEYVGRDSPPMNPDCSGGVCLFTESPELVAQVCTALFGYVNEKPKACFSSEIKAGWQSRPGLVSIDICNLANDRGLCRQELFGARQ